MTLSAITIGRRALALGGLALAASPGLPSLAASPRRERFLPPQTRWSPPPAQAPAREGQVDVGGVRLWYWDTGGPGEPVVLLHPATGSAAVWGYQQPVFAKAGYRVIAYSRRGHYRSETGPPDKPGAAAADLHVLVEQLGLGRFHLVGCAAGGFSVCDYALSHPDRIASLVIASSRGGVEDEAYNALSAALAPPTFARMPPEMREVGPSYRAGYPQGVAAWLALEHEALTGERLTQAMLNRVTWAAMETIAAPALVLTGDADLYQPPVLARIYASHLRASEVAIIGEAGHAAHWEQPLAFNAALLDFFRRRRAR